LLKIQIIALYFLIGKTFKSEQPLSTLGCKIPVSICVVKIMLY